MHIFHSNRSNFCVKVFFFLLNANCHFTVQCQAGFCPTDSYHCAKKTKKKKKNAFSYLCRHISNRHMHACTHLSNSLLFDTPFQAYLHLSISHPCSFLLLDLSCPLAPIFLPLCADAIFYFSLSLSLFCQSASLPFN